MKNFKTLSLAICGIVLTTTISCRTDNAEMFDEANAKTQHEVNLDFFAKDGVKMKNDSMRIESDSTKTGIYGRNLINKDSIKVAP